MEVECVKYHERMDSEVAECRHPGDYCKFRTSCIIQFMCSEKKPARPENKDQAGQDRENGKKDG